MEETTSIPEEQSECNTYTLLYMAIIKLQGETEYRKGIYYEFDSSDRPLGEGGMGKVYKGRCINERTGASQVVAIKFMYSDLPEHAIERARREASIRLHNDNLVEMLGFIETSEKNVIGETIKRYHVVSELLEGVVLDDLIQGKTTDQNGRLIPFAEKLYLDYQNNPFKFAISVIQNILSGIMALHDAGYIHRDIDPTNIMITTNGQIKLIDFGIAKALNSLGTHDKALTSSGMFIGKPWYAAPELVLGDIKHQNKTTDIYAIGILFYQLYVGKLPFDGAQHEVLDMQLKKKLSTKAIPRKDVRDIIAKATKKKQEERYQSAAELRVDLDKLPIEAPKPVPTLWIASGVGVAACLLSAIMFWPDDLKEEDDIPVKSEITYAEAVNKLKSNTTKNEGLSELTELSNSGNYEATYLLSRLKFDGGTKKEFDNIPDSIWQLQLASQIRPNHEEAHELLKKAVELNPNDCNSLYDLGFDYLVGNRETYEGRQLEKSKQCLDKAMELAKKNGNQQILESIEKLFKEYADDFQELEKQ